MVPSPETSSSPKWGQTTKLVVGLTFVAIIAALLIQFRSIIGPLILAFILSYLLYPLSARFSAATTLSWRAAVNIIYLVLVVLLGGLITLTGLAVIQQIQSLIGVVERFIEDLPTLVAQISTLAYRIGPFELNFSQLNLQELINQLLPNIQGVVTRIGGLVSTFATGAAGTLGWTLFVILISYFLLADAGRVPNRIVPLNIPGYNEDISRLSTELRFIWNAFLRGQLIIISLVILSYSVLMMILGVRYAIGIAILAGLARFVPYVGPLITTVVTFLVAFLQNGNRFDLQPLTFALLVIALSFVLDQIFDNLISPRLMGTTLGVHPAAVLVAAIVAANLIGIIGLVLAAPVLATIQLVGRYITRKMFDLDPWSGLDENPSEENELAWARNIRRARAWWRLMRDRGISPPKQR